MSMPAVEVNVLAHKVSFTDDDLVVELVDELADIHARWAKHSAHRRSWCGLSRFNLQFDYFCDFFCHIVCFAKSSKYQVASIKKLPFDTWCIDTLLLV